ncbi:M55 family metallopeptidase [Candidatus Aminicenantes bacterium AC-335-A11]|jgi:D-amino peptidase|nr:M55 family metallopeptidase [SCandidatus Aminicenantes bacterium Aminicenantia_JdfR_composite]MCP2597968.1 M55 family metallopeptidase [Candidatus Aminicenantes bacterium AC-335-L06]MCP2618172.1 M55 family metallopeptidase [Candidatus Aminicenantes bacterium AC-335-A11]
MNKQIFRVLIFILILISVNNYLISAEKLKVYISVDMEGIAGVVHREQSSSAGKDYNIARKWMIEETNAVIQGALDAGATEIVVNDSHGSMRNIILSELHPSAYLITGSPKPLSMMQGIDDSFDAVIFIGYHAKAGTKNGVLDHTYSGSSIYSIRINNIEMPEVGINALVAGYFDVPVVLVSGDSEVCFQAKELLSKEIEVVPVKEGIGRYAAKCLPLNKAFKLLREKTKLALKKRSKIKPFKLDPPYTFELEFNFSYQADYPELIPGVKRKNGRTVYFVIKDYIEGFKLMRALIALARSQ